MIEQFTMDQSVGITEYNLIESYSRVQGIRLKLFHKILVTSYSQVYLADP